MSDTATPTTPVSEAQPKKKRAKRSAPGNNPKVLNELTKAEQIALSAKKSVYKLKLAVRKILAGDPAALEAQCAAARKKCADTLQSNTSKVGATDVEGIATRDLIIGLQEVQAAAKQKYARTNPVVLRDYYIGEHLNGSRSRLEQTSAAILEKLDDDDLPGITADKIEALSALREAYVDADSTQTDGKVEVSTDVQAVKKMLKDIQDERIRFQFAADAEWPYTNPANAPIRREFYLPLKRPFTVKLTGIPKT